MFSYKKNVIWATGYGMLLDWGHTLEIFWIKFKWKSGYHYDK